MHYRISAALGAAALALACAGQSLAQVPPDIEAKLKALGRVVAPQETAKIYRPLFGPDFMNGVASTKGVAFGTDPKQKLNVYYPAAGGGAPREVLVFVPGGPGTNQMGGPEGAPFYDNVASWAVKNGLVLVVTQYRTGNDVAWDAGVKDVAATLEWVKANIAAKGGDPSRVVVWGQSNGATQLGGWLGHPDLRGAGASNVKGVVLMSGAFNILPLKLKSPPAGREPAPATAPAAPRPAPVDPAVMLQRSNLEGVKATTIPLMLATCELDPEERNEMVEVLTAELTRAGHPPVHILFPGHSHISEVFSFGTADHTTSDPVLKFVRSVK